MVPSLDGIEVDVAAAAATAPVASRPVAVIAAVANFTALVFISTP
jgi:hypothetical protein